MKSDRAAWEQRVEQFVDLRSDAARQAERSPEPRSRALASAHRALAEGAWYVLELARQHPERSTDGLRQMGATTLARWQSSGDPDDRDRWRAADWALWAHEARRRHRLRRSRLGRGGGPEPQEPPSDGGA